MKRFQLYARAENVVFNTRIENVHGGATMRRRYSIVGKRSRRTVILLSILAMSTSAERSEAFRGHMHSLTFGHGRLPGDSSGDQFRSSWTVRYRRFDSSADKGESQEEESAAAAVLLNSIEGNGDNSQQIGPSSPTPVDQDEEIDVIHLAPPSDNSSVTINRHDRDSLATSAVLSVQESHDNGVENAKVDHSQQRPALQGSKNRPFSHYQYGYPSNLSPGLLFDGVNNKVSTAQSTYEGDATLFPVSMPFATHQKAKHLTKSKDTSKQLTPSKKAVSLLSKGINGVHSGGSGGHSPDDLISCLPDLIRMCRLNNFPGVIVMHVLTVYLMQRTPVVAAALGGTSLKSLLFRPNSITIMICTLIISAVSMVVNDYFDAKSGTDMINKEVEDQQSQSYTLRDEAANLHQNDSGKMAKLSKKKPLVTGEVSMDVAKQFIRYLYAILLALSMAIPSLPGRLCVVLSAVITYFYTNTIKPITVWKNFACAGLVALGPFASAIITAHPLSGWMAFGSIWRFCAALFTWVVCREVIMDLKDYVGDRAIGVQTIPVRHGKRFATWTSLMFAALCAGVAIGGPISDVISDTFASKGSTVGYVHHMLSPQFRLILGGIGGVDLMRRIWKVVQNEGDDVQCCALTVEETMISFAFILASFI